MPTVAVAYLSVLGALTCFSWRWNTRRRIPRVVVAATFSGDVILGLLFVAYYHAPTSDALGRWALPLFAVGFMTFCLTRLYHGVRIKDDPTDSALVAFSINLGGILLGVLVYTPLIAYGWLAAVRAWATAI